MSALPWWFYMGSLIGVASHVVNLSNDDPDTIDATYFSAITGYTVGALGLGYGALQYITTPSPSELGVDSQAQLKRRLPRVSWLRVKLSF